MALRDAGDPLPAGAILYSPWTDLAATGASLVENDASDVMFRGAWMARGATLYLGDSGVPADHPLASPLYADFTGLPPLHCYVSTSEVLRDDTLRMAERARAAGVSVSVELGRRLPHVWPIFYPFLPEARKALRQSGDAVRRMTAAARCRRNARRHDTDTDGARKALHARMEWHRTGSPSCVG